MDKQWRQREMQEDPYYCARLYTERGLRVFPLLEGSKRPRYEWAIYREEEMSTADMHVEFAIAACNIGVVCGPPSGITVIDCDTRDDAVRFRAIVPKSTPIVMTPKGAHFYFQHTGERNGVKLEYEGITFDIRGDGGYVVAPPSKVEGRSYQWLEPFRTSGNLPMVPRKVRGAIERQAESRKKFGAYKGNLLGGVVEGSRNVTLTSMVGYLLHHSIDPDITAMIAHAVNDTKFRPPLPTTEVDTILSSIMERERSK